MLHYYGKAKGVLALAGLFRQLKDNKPLFLVTVFASFTAVCLIVAVTLLLADSGIETFLGRRSFSDFFETLTYAVLKNPYIGEGSIRSNYPPLSILIVYPFSFLCRDAINKYISGEIGLEYIYKDTGFLIAYFIFYLISLLFLCFAFYKFIPKGRVQKRYFLGALIFSGPILYCFGRGNVLLLAVAFAVLFFAYYNSASRIGREFSNVFLALSISIKLYPVVFALIFIKDGRFADLIKTAVYSAVLVFVPLLCFDGSFAENVVLFIKGLLGFAGSAERVTHWTNVSADFILYGIAEAVKNLFGADLYGAADAVSAVLHIGFVLFAFALVCLSRGTGTDWRFTAFLCCTYFMCGKIMYGYNLVIFIIPFVYYMQDGAQIQKKEKIAYGVCYLVFFIPILYLFKVFSLQLAAFLFLTVLSSRGLIRNIKAKKNAYKVWEAAGGSPDKEKKTEGADTFRGSPEDSSLCTGTSFFRAEA